MQAITLHIPIKELTMPQDLQISNSFIEKLSTSDDRNIFEKWTTSTDDAH